MHTQRSIDTHLFAKWEWSLPESMKSAAHTPVGFYCVRDSTTSGKQQLLSLGSEPLARLLISSWPNRLDRQASQKWPFFCYEPDKSLPWWASYRPFSDTKMRKMPYWGNCLLWTQGAFHKGILQPHLLNFAAGACCKGNCSRFHFTSFIEWSQPKCPLVALLGLSGRHTSPGLGHNLFSYLAWCSKTRDPNISISAFQTSRLIRGCIFPPLDTPDFKLVLLQYNQVNRKDNRHYLGLTFTTLWVH